MPNRKWTRYLFNAVILQTLLKVFCVAGLLCFAVFGFADNTDLLSGTTKVAVDTFNNSGKIFIYIAEFVMAAAMYIKTRSIMTFVGILVVAFVMTTLAGHFIGS